MDINFLLAKEQVSLLRARFAPEADAQRRHFAAAADVATTLRLTAYPHRQLALGMLT